MWRAAAALAVVSSVACAAPLEVGPEIVGIGIVTGMPDDVAMPTIAENRALDSVRRQFTPGAVQFRFESAEGFSILETTVPTAKIVSGGARLIPVRGGWMARARTERDADVVAFMRTLPLRRVSSEVSHSSLGTAMRLAESRAVRAAISDASRPFGGGAGRYTGAMTIGAMRVKVGDRSVTVDMLVHIEIRRHDPITDDERKRILTAVAEERRKLGEVDAALEPIDRALELFADDAALHALRGELLLERGDRQEAGEAFSRAAELAPEAEMYASRLEEATGEPPEARDSSACQPRGPDPGSTLNCGDRVCTRDGACQVAFWSVEAGGNLSCGITLDGVAMCWGDGGEHGVDEPPTDTLTRISVGSDHACGIEPDGSVECWGNDDANQSSPPPEPFVQISAGSGELTCGVTREQAARCWGDVESLAIPDGVFVEVSAGLMHACGRTDGGAVLCWGVGAAPPDGTFTRVEAGDAHTCALREDGTAVCWGDAAGGKLEAPDEPLIQLAAGGGHTCGLTVDRRVVCWGRGQEPEPCDDESGQCGQALPPADAFTQITAGLDHTCGIRSDGFVSCWGRNDAGQATPPAALSE